MVSLVEVLVLSSGETSEPWCGGIAKASGEGDLIGVGFYVIY
jgi:hypothetical protein